MKRVIVRYRVKKNRVAEHEALIHDVFAELAKKEPAGFRYGVFKEPDGVTFVHIATIEGKGNPPREDQPRSAPSLRKISERAVRSNRKALDLQEAGNYRF